MFIFPGVGLGVLAAGARRGTDGMFLAAARALSAAAPSRSDRGAPLYPDIEHVQVAARAVAIAVATEAVRTGVGEPLDAHTLEQHVDALTWEPRYRPLTRDNG